MGNPFSGDNSLFFPRKSVAWGGIPYSLLAENTAVNIFLSSPPITETLSAPLPLIVYSETGTIFTGVWSMLTICC